MEQGGRGGGGGGQQCRAAGKTWEKLLATGSDLCDPIPPAHSIQYMPQISAAYPDKMGVAQLSGQTSKSLSIFCFFFFGVKLVT